MKHGSVTAQIGKPKTFTWEKKYGKETVNECEWELEKLNSSHNSFTNAMQLWINDWNLSILKLCLSLPGAKLVVLNHFSVSAEFHTNSISATILKISWGHIKVSCVRVCFYQVFSPSVPPSDILSSRGAHPNPRLSLSFSFLPGESYGQRSLAGYSPRGSKEDTPERLSLTPLIDSVQQCKIQESTHICPSCTRLLTTVRIARTGARNGLLNKSAHLLPRGPLPLTYSQFYPARTRSFLFL